MVRKILLGVVEGAVLGVLIAVTIGRLHLGWGSLVAYAAVATLGAVLGAVTGRPIWAHDAKLEAGLKSGAGALIGATAMYGARKWLSGVHVDLVAVGGSAGSIGDVPLALLPAIGAALGFVFEADNAFGSEEKGVRKRVASPPAESLPREEDAEESVSSERPLRRER